MSFTHVEVEEHKTRKLLLLFTFLVVLYALSIVALYWGVRVSSGYSTRVPASQWLAILGVTVAITICHWAISTVGVVPRVLASIRASALDPGDTYHTRLKNIVEEVSVATGGRYRITPYVIPTSALNACAVSDTQGHAAIAVTEGLLARLNRAQLESVVGHEAAHIASGDSIANTIFCGLFALHEEGLKRLSGIFDDRRSAVGIRGRGASLIIVVMIILWVTNKIKRSCELLISRAQEYRADAVAVRLTRNPLSLAEALHIIDKHWRGIGMMGESLSAIFIVDTGGEFLSEREGATAEAFSTHPPTRRRIELLLGMGHVAQSDFDIAARQLGQPLKRLRAREPVPDAAQANQRWSIFLQGAWNSPLALERLLREDALQPNTWVRREGEQSVQRAADVAALRDGLRQRYRQQAGAQQVATSECPNCRVSLTQVMYEGVPLDECPACHGCYIMPHQLRRIVTREEYAFPESIQRLAKTARAMRGKKHAAKAFAQSTRAALKGRRCSTCQSAVLRKFYTHAYLVEVEQCLVCDLTWLDRDELEILQCLYEKDAEW